MTNFLTHKSFWYPTSRQFLSEIPGFCNSATTHSFETGKKRKRSVFVVKAEKLGFKVIAILFFQIFHDPGVSMLHQLHQLHQLASVAETPPTFHCSVQKRNNSNSENSWPSSGWLWLFLMLANDIIIKC